MGIDLAIKVQLKTKTIGVSSILLRSDCNITRSNNTKHTLQMSFINKTMHK